MLTTEQLEAFCDDYCRYPRAVDDNGEMEEICRLCPLAKMEGSNEQVQAS